MNRYLIWGITLFLLGRSYAQTNLILGSYVNPGQYTNQQQITLTPGMSATGYAGDSRLYIDPTIFLNSNPPASGSYGTSAVNYNLDLSKPVGTIPYSFDVSPIGSAECDVPIKCPMGTNNMQPSLSFHYSSLAGEGELGDGWSVGGLQKVTRFGNTYYHNGSEGGINLTNSDNFALNGNRLLPPNPYVNGANGTVYTPERNDFSRVTSYGSVGNGPAWFKVETKDGMTLEFGNTSASRLIPVNATTIMEWYLNKVTDVFGNYMTFDYYNSGGEVLIKEVAYTGNPSIGMPYNFVRFYYNNKASRNTKFVCGGEATEKSILRMVEIRQDNSFVAQYNFNYVSYFNHSFLTEIKLKGSDYTELNSLMFSYENDAGAPLSQACTNIVSPTMYSKYLSLDFTGDGIKDMVAFDGMTFNGNYAMYYDWQTWRALKNNGGGAFQQLGGNTSLPAGNVSEPFMGAANKGGFANYMYAAYDFNGDNKEDFVLVNFGFSYDNFYIYISNGSGFNAPHLFTIQKVNNGNNTPPPNKFWFLDLNSDGKLDLLYSDNIGENQYPAVQPTVPGQFLFISVLDVATAANVQYSNYITTPQLMVVNNARVNNSTFASNGADAARVVDMNADGKAELLISSYNSPSTYSVLSTNAANAIQNTLIPNSNAFVSIDHPNYITLSGSFQLFSYTNITLDGDFNGDGKSDFITGNITGAGASAFAYNMYLGKGDNTFTSAIPLSGQGLQKFTNSGVYYFTGDLNNDGKTDIIERQSSAIKVYYSKGNDASGNYFFSETYSGITFSPRDFDITDVDGNGIADIISYGAVSGNTAPNVIYFRKGAISRNIKQIVDAFGKTTEVSSAPITDPTVYSQPAPLNNQSYPLSILNAPLYVVKQVKTADGIGGVLTENYTYENGIVHKLGKNFLCFSKITKSNPVADLKIVTEYGFDPSKFFTYCTKMSTYNLSTNQLIRDETFAYAAFTYGTLSYYNFCNASTQNNYIQNYTTYNQHTYDINGNLVFTEKNVAGGLDKEQAFYSGFVSNGSWMVYKPTNIYKVVTRSGQLPYDGTTTFAYTPQGLIQTLTEEPSDAKKVVKIFTYDGSSGMVVSKYVYSPGSGLPVINESYSYDPRFRLVTQLTNALNQVSSTKYNFIFGKPAETTDFGGLKTNYTYDGYGNTLMVKSPDNTTVNYSYNWVTSGDFTGSDPLSTSRCLYKVSAFSNGHPATASYCDMFGRELRKETQGFSGDPHFTMVEFDALGRRSQDVDSYQLIQGNPLVPVKTTYAYDILGRLITKSTTDGTNTKNWSYTYSYASGDVTSTTTHPDGKVTSKTDDASSLLKRATDNGGTIDYFYYSNRKTKSIKVNGVQSEYMEYDRFGRQTKLQNRDAGLLLYDYNAYGQLASQTDANNKTYNFTYDALGRLVNKTGPDGTYSYQYVTAGVAINSILLETAPNGYFTQYYYDQYGRNNKIEENIAGQSYKTSYTYDQYGRLEKTAYPSGFTTKNVYNTFGYVSKIVNDANNQNIWICSSTNALGEVSAYVSGNGKVTQITYDNYGFPLLFNTPGVQSIANDFDYLNGNLRSRTDQLLGKTEQFTFDNLDRLTKSQVATWPGLSPTLGAFNITYDANNVNIGHVTSKGDLGTFSYHNTKPDAINNVSNPNGVINTAPTANNQNINYTAFNKVANIFEGNYQYDVFYGCDQQRRKADLYNSSSLVYSRIYAGDYEKTVQGANTTEVHYIQGPAGLCAMYVITNGTGAMYYTYSDYQGSITKVTDASGTIVADLNYDAWGRMRNNTTWDYANPSLPPSWLYRGYTGHEHLPEFALINMNGRLYDPALGAMLSPDNFNQNSAFTQNFNRYAYGYNNPLKFVDPSGQWIQIAIGALVGGVINVALHWNKIMASDHPWRDGLVAFGIGAVGGAVAAATFGASVAAEATALEVATAAGMSAMSGEMVTNMGNVAYFHDPVDGPKEYAATFLTGFALGYVGKVVYDAVSPKRLYMEPEYLEPKTIDRIPTTPTEELEIIPMENIPAPEPIPMVSEPQPMTLNKTVDLDGNIKFTLAENNSGTGFKSLSELGLQDNMRVSSRQALEYGEQFLGKGYTEPVPGSGRYVSSDGTRAFRMGTSDITGAHGGGPHVNFETLAPNPAKPGKMMVTTNLHIYIFD